MFFILYFVIDTRRRGFFGVLLRVIKVILPIPFLFGNKVLQQYIHVVVTMSVLSNMLVITLMGYQCINIMSL